MRVGISIIFGSLLLADAKAQFQRNGPEITVDPLSFMRQTGFVPRSAQDFFITQGNEVPFTNDPLFGGRVNPNGGFAPVTNGGGFAPVASGGGFASTINGGEFMAVQPLQAVQPAEPDPLQPVGPIGSIGPISVQPAGPFEPVQPVQPL